ncbi:hypothetical protein IAU60_006926 [Kwoniella sp. DSM 27419]
MARSPSDPHMAEENVLALLAKLASIDLSSAVAGYMLADPTREDIVERASERLSVLNALMFEKRKELAAKDAQELAALRLTLQRSEQALAKEREATKMVKDKHAELKGKVKKRHSVERENEALLKRRKEEVAERERLLMEAKTRDVALEPLPAIEVSEDEADP